MSLRRVLFKVPIFTGRTFSTAVQSSSSLRRFNRPSNFGLLVPTRSWFSGAAKKSSSARDEGFSGSKDAQKAASQQAEADEVQAQPDAENVNQTSYAEPNVNEEPTAAESAEGNSPTAQLQARIDELESQIAALEAKNEDLQTRNESYMRAAQDWKEEALLEKSSSEAVRRNAREDVVRAKSHAISKMAGDIVSIMDVLEKALELAQKQGLQNEPAAASFVEGIERTEQTAFKALAKHGVTRQEIVPAQTQFDPNIHDAVSTASDNTVCDGAILRVFMTGWELDGKPMRAAKVIVNENPDMPAPPPPEPSAEPSEEEKESK